MSKFSIELDPKSFLTFALPPPEEKNGELPPPDNGDIFPPVNGELPPPKNGDEPPPPPPPPIAPKIIDSSPHTVNIIEGANQYIFASATDTDPLLYKITVDGVLHDSGNWSSPRVLRYYCTDLSVGTHTISFFFSDQTGLSTEKTILVVVEVAPSTLPPVITDSNIDTLLITEGDHQIVFATAEDVDPSTYEITVNGTVHDSGGWSLSPMRLEYDCVNLPEGTHSIIIRFSDQSGLHSISSTTVIVASGGNGEENGEPEWWEEIDILWVLGGIVLIAGVGTAAWVLLPK